MGDNPDSLLWVPGCFMTVWPNELEPAAMLVNITGIQKGTYWEPAFGEPPDGTYLFTHSACATWTNTEVGDIAYLRLGIYGYFLDWWYREGSIPYFTAAGTGELDDQVTFQNPSTFPSDPFYSGTGYAYTNNPIGVMPASWDAADLVGVPKVRPYKAEELPTTIASRKLRYAAHRDGTNVKVYLE